MNRKVKSFKQSLIGKLCSVKRYNKCSKCSLSSLTQAHYRFATRLLLCR